MLLLISDNETPRLTSDLLNITEVAGAMIGDVVVSWTEPTITDNSGSVTVTSDYQSGDRFPIGDTSVSYTATDPSENSDVFSFLVTVTVEGKITLFRL